MDHDAAHLRCTQDRSRLLDAPRPLGRGVKRRFFRCYAITGRSVEPTAAGIDIGRRRAAMLRLESTQECGYELLADVFRVGREVTDHLDDRFDRFGRIHPVFGPAYVAGHRLHAAGTEAVFRRLRPRERQDLMPSRQQRPDNRCADKTRSAQYQDSHAAILRHRPPLDVPLFAQLGSRDKMPGMRKIIVAPEFPNYPEDWHFSPAIDTGGFVVLSGITGVRPDQSLSS